MLALAHTCLHPETQKPYLKSITGGKDNSIEGIQVAFALNRSPFLPLFVETAC